MSSYVKAARLADLPPGAGATVSVGGTDVALFNVDGTVHALDDRCLHRGGPLGMGRLEGAVVTCPWHGWQFDVTTGAMVMNASSRVACHGVKVDGDDLLVALRGT